MSKAVLISIQPKWCNLIVNGEKTVEVRKTRPNLETPFKCYIYCTKDPKLQFWTGPRYSYADDHSHNAFDRCGNGKVIGEFVCSGFDEITPTEHGVKFKRFIALFETRLSVTELRDYLNGQPGYGWRISKLMIYDTPKLLSEFCRFGAIKQENLDEELCDYCKVTRGGGSPFTQTPDGYWACEGRWCSEAYQKYLDENFAVARAPQSWCYVEDLTGGADHA